MMSERYKKLVIQRPHNVPRGRSIKVHSERSLTTLLERSINVRIRAHVRGCSQAIESNPMQTGNLLMITLKRLGTS